MYGSVYINTSVAYTHIQWISYTLTAFISGEQYILNGGLRVYSSRSFNAAGNFFQYVRTSAEESLFTTGPLQEPLTVQVSYTIVVDNIHYTLHCGYPQ